MPHKRNPILSENIVGLARVVRSYAMPAFENVALWHERDMSHSSVERFIAPDATITLDFALNRMTGVIDKLIVRADRMRKNLDSTQGIIHSQRALLALTQAGMERETAYKLVQKNAMRAWNGEGTLLELLKADPDVSRAVPAKALEAMFDLGYHTKEVDTIFNRVFGQ
jgi:adenylosuccinate lyase